MGPDVLSKRRWKPLEWISGQSVTLNTDLKPMPFCPGEGDSGAVRPLGTFRRRRWSPEDAVTLLPTYVPVLVLALGAAADVADGSDVLLQESRLIVQDGDAVVLHHERQRWNDPGL